MKIKKNNFFKLGKNTLKNGEIVNIDKAVLHSLDDSFETTKYPRRLYKDISRSKKDFNEYLIFIKSLNEANVYNSTKRGVNRGAKIGSLIGAVGGGALGAAAGLGAGAGKFAARETKNAYNRLRGKSNDNSEKFGDRNKDAVKNTWDYVKAGHKYGAQGGSLIGAGYGAVTGGTAGAGIALGKNAYNIIRNGIRYRNGQPLQAPGGNRNFQAFNGEKRRPGRPSEGPKPKPVKYIKKNGNWEKLKGRPPKGAEVKTVYENEINEGVYHQKVNESMKNKMNRPKQSFLEFLDEEEINEKGLFKDITKGAWSGAKTGAKTGAKYGGGAGAVGGGATGAALGSTGSALYAAHSPESGVSIKHAYYGGGAAGGLGGAAAGGALGAAAGGAAGGALGAVGGAAKGAYRHFFPKKDKKQGNVKANPVGRPKKINGRPKKFNEGLDESVWGATKSTLKGAGKGAAVGGAIGGLLAARTSHRLGTTGAATVGSGVGGSAIGAVPGAIVGAARGLRSHFKKQGEEKNKPTPPQKPLVRQKRKLSGHLQEEVDILEGKRWDRFKQAAKDGYKEGSEKADKWAEKHLPGHGKSFKQIWKEGNKTDLSGRKSNLGRPMKKISENSLNLQIASPVLDANVKDTKPNTLEIIRKGKLKRDEVTD